MKRMLFSCALTAVAGLATLDEAWGQYGPPSHGGGRPYTAQMAPGYPGGIPPAPLPPPMIPPTWPGMAANTPVAYYQDPAMMMPAMEPMMAAPASTAKSDCGDCGDCDACGRCCSGIAMHRTGGFGEFLYLRPRDAEVAYGAILNDELNDPAAVQVGRTGVLDPDYEAAFKVGLTLAIDSCSSIAVSYSDFNSNTRDTINVSESFAPNVNNTIGPYLVHPATMVGANNSQFTSARGDLGVDFVIVDVDYRAVLTSSPNGVLNYVVGVRYGQLQQELLAIYTNPGTATITSDVDFWGAGVKFGLDGERHHVPSGLFVFGRGNVSFLGGEQTGSYRQTSTFAPVLLGTDWEAARLVTTLDLEVGGGIQTCNGRVRWTIGYVYSGWFNTLQTDEFISAVHRNDYVNLGGEGMSFDGLTSRVELRW